MTTATAVAQGLQVVELDECAVCEQVAPVNPDGVCGSCLDRSRGITAEYAPYLGLTPEDLEYFSTTPEWTNSDYFVRAGFDN